MRACRSGNADRRSPKVPGGCPRRSPRLRRSCNWHRSRCARPAALPGRYDSPGPPWQMRGFRRPLRPPRAHGLPERGDSPGRKAVRPGRSRHRGRRTRSWAGRSRPAPLARGSRPRRGCRAIARGSGRAKGSKGRRSGRFPGWRFAGSRHRDRLSAPRRAWRRSHSAGRYARWIASRWGPADSLARTRFVQRLDDLVGNVDAGVRPHDLFVLKHDIELFGLGDLLHRPMGALDQTFELSLAPVPQILVEFPVSSLKVRVEVAELALPLLALRLRHGHGVLLQALLHLLQLLRQPRELLTARGELLFQLLLGALRSRRFLQDPLQADEADARLGKRRTCGREQRRQGPTNEGFSRQTILLPTDTCFRKNNYTGPSECVAECELDALDIVPGLVVQRPCETDLHRPDRRVPGKADSRRRPHLRKVEFIVRSVNLASVDERSEAHRPVKTAARHGKQQLRRYVDLAVAAEEAAVYVARAQGRRPVSAYAADAPRVVVLEKRQRLSAIAVAEVELAAQHERKIARERIEVLVGVGILPVFQVSGSRPELQAGALDLAFRRPDEAVARIVGPAGRADQGEIGPAELVLKFEVTLRAVGGEGKRDVLRTDAEKQGVEIGRAHV